MSSTVAPSRIRPRAEGELIAAVRTLLASAVLVALLVTMTPFQVEYEGGEAGNVVNQVGYTVLAGVALLGHLLFTERSVALSLLRPSWLLMAGFLLISALQAADPGGALRAVLFSILAMVAVTGALCLPPDPRRFRIALTIAALVVLGISYLGVVALPGLAIHSAGGAEGQHAGLWRGAYSHKNVAGAIMAALFFCGVYLLRCRSWLAGGTITLLAAFFVVQTGSKTAAGLLPAVALLVMSSRLAGGRVFPVVVLSLAITVMGLMTLGSVLVPALNDVLQAILPGTTFTGRTDLWRFALDLMRERQWTGFGFESFWLTPVVTGAEPGDTLSWDPRGIVNGHNGYLDVAIAAGWPGLAVALAVLVVLPFRDFMRSGDDPESSRLADLFLMILAFALMNAFLESFLFARGNPVWLMLWLSVAGLRLLERNRPRGDEGVTDILERARRPS